MFEEDSSTLILNPIRSTNSFKKSSMKKKRNLYSKPRPICYIEYGNNSELIENILTSIGYQCLNDKIDDFKLKWVQSIQNINWNLFIDGKQMVNHILGEDYFTNKLQLYQSLQTYQNTYQIISKPSIYYLDLNQFIPQTFKLDEINDRNRLFHLHQHGDIWICKPSGLNQGKGIYLVRDINQLKDKYIQNDSSKQNYYKSMKTIVQRYIINPLLVNGKKFDIRCYMLISSVQPLIILYHEGYIRLSLFDFDPNHPNLLIHLTNQCVQKKDPTYVHLKEETAWTMEQLNDYLNQHSSKQNIQKDWVKNVLPKMIERIMLNVIESIRMRLRRRIGCFGLYGFDFLIDENLKVWLIEINSNPALTTNTNILLEVIPPIVKEAILISIECFEKVRHGDSIFPLKSLKGFQCIYNECNKKSSFPLIEQEKGFLSSYKDSNKIVRSSSFIDRSNLTKTVQEQHSLVSFSNHQLEKHQTKKLLTNPILSIDNNNFLSKFHSFQRSQTNYENFKRSQIISEQQNNSIGRENKRPSLRRTKSVGRFKKSFKKNQNIQTETENNSFINLQ